ncbi:TPA: hypothetical protein N0F65_012090 [Lagenidium giganteum]|uniref:Leucine-rich repeat domain-containing protein n=1 Tax=Lagenidium giganteum TaxID=4803 RepID=A0AAV2YU94_9STRA|nr:TPA: hypothetical protein N0F65_012090 [Lagenidium giganteum]
MAPWLATKYPCAVYNYDCAFLNTTTPAPGSLAFLDEHVLVTLNFVHCSALVMLPEAQRFKQLLGFNLKHVTLIDWSRAAAITPDCFPYMVFLCLAYVNLTKIPDGMLGPLPPLLQDIEFTHTNLSVIPDDLYEHWPSVGMLYFEFSGIQQVPDTLTQMPLFDFSLIGNQIHNVSILAAMPTIGVYVSVDLNPITTLPMAFDQAEVALVVLSAEHTQLADASEQLLSKIRALYAAGTPLCASEAALDTTVVCDSDYARASGKCFLF